MGKRVKVKMLRPEVEKEVEKLKKLHRFYKTGPYSKLGIAKALGVDRKAVQRWFTGEFEPTKRHTVQIKGHLKERGS